MSTKNHTLAFAFTMLFAGAASAQHAVSLLPTGTAAPTKAHVPMRERFAELDANHDGALTMAEISEREPHMAKHFQQIDANGNGRISIEELRQFKRQRHAEKMARQSSSLQQPESPPQQ